MLKLICLDAVAPIGEFQVDDFPITIGRSPDATIQINDSWASRIHSEFSRTEDGTVSVRDLGSSNGTLVNGKPVQQRELAEGDKVTVGITTFRVQYTVPVGYSTDELIDSLN